MTVLQHFVLPLLYWYQKGFCVMFLHPSPPPAHCSNTPIIYIWKSFQSPSPTRSPPPIPFPLLPPIIPNPPIIRYSRVDTNIQMKRFTAIVKSFYTVVAKLSILDIFGVLPGPLVPIYLFSRWKIYWWKEAKTMYLLNIITMDLKNGIHFAVAINNFGCTQNIQINQF